MRLIRVAGEEIRYKTFGKGKPLVLLHGFGGNHLDWFDVAKGIDQTKYEILIPNFTSLYLDPSREIGFSQQVQLVRAFLEVFADNKGKVKVAGTSYGGALAWAVGIMAPEIIEKMILVNPMPPHPIRRVKDPVLKLFIQMAKNPQALGLFVLSPAGRLLLPHLERLFRFAYLEEHKRRRRVAHMTRRKLNVILHVVNRFLWINDQENWSFWDKKLSHMVVPVQLLWGDHDKLYDRKVYLRFDKSFPNCSIRNVSAGKHMMVRDRFESLSKHMTNFFDPHLKAVP